MWTLVLIFGVSFAEPLEIEIDIGDDLKLCVSMASELYSQIDDMAAECRGPDGAVVHIGGTGRES